MREKKGSTYREQADPLYTPADFYLLRTPVLSAEIYLLFSSTDRLALHTDSKSAGRSGQTVQANCYQLLRDLIEQPQIRLAIAVASPSLLDGIERLRAGKASSAQAERTYRGVLRYLIRMCTRPTPFGLFSGVALGTFAEYTNAKLAVPTIASIRTRPDMSWLLDVIQQMEEQQEIVHQLRVRTNQTAYMAGGRVWLPRADVYGQQDNRAISLRATSVVVKTLQFALHGLPYADLATQLQRAYPQATAEQIKHLLWDLWEHHFLLSELHPPLTEAQPVNYLMAQLASVQSARSLRIPDASEPLQTEARQMDIEEVKTTLEAIYTQSAALDEAGFNAPTTLLDQLVASQAQLVAQGNSQPQIQIDTALCMRAVTCNREIAKAAARMAELLLRLTPLPQGSFHLQDYQQHFLEHYGEGAEIPLLDLLSPENGLDAPTGYTQPPRAYPLPTLVSPPDTEKREQILQDIVAQAINQRSNVVDLTEDLLKQLEHWSPRAEQAPLSLEIYLQMQATSREALDRGEWCAVIGPGCGSPMAGRTFGRFFDLLEEQGREQLQQFMAREEALQSNAIFAELSYQPPHARITNVTFHPMLRSYEIVVGTTPSVPPERVIPLNDLVVGIRGGRFYLRSLRLGKRVIVTQSHMLNILYAPNVCRFLIEASSAGQPILSGFKWGRAAGSPFLPRLICKINPTATLVLSPAQWTLRAETLEPGESDKQAGTWFERLQRWREQWRVSRYVYLTEADNRLLLDLEHPLMAEEIHGALAKLTADEYITLQELLPDFNHLWLRDEENKPYFAEIVVPLLRNATSSAKEASVTRNNIEVYAPARIVSKEERTLLPGDAWIYFNLYAASSQHDAIIAGPMRDLTRRLQEQELIDRWFFIRYRDPQPHLRLRIHARYENLFPACFTEMLQWSRQLSKQDLIQRFSIESYEREVERYGGPATIDLLEQVFCLDSEMTSTLIAAQYTRRLTLDPIEIAVFSANHFFRAWGYDIAACLHWLERRTEKYAWSAEFRPQRKRYCELLSPWAPHPDPELARQRERLLTLLTPQEAALRDLGNQVRTLIEAGELWVREEDLLGSLSHMHKIRLLDLERQKEEQMYAFWRHTLQSIKLRPDKKDNETATL